MWQRTQLHEEYSGVIFFSTDIISNYFYKDLELFAKLYDPPGTPVMQARLPALHSQQLQNVVKKLSSSAKKIGDLKEQYCATWMWDETSAQKKNIISSRKILNLKSKVKCKHS